MKEPLFIRFVNKEIGASDLLETYERSGDPFTQAAVHKAREEMPDLEPFREELTGAVRDIIATGLGEEFRAFVNHYMADSLEEDVQRAESQFGENVSRSARVKDPSAPWMQGLLCYNLCLYIKAFGLDNLKACRTCGKIFDHKGKFAVYCSDPCKAKGKEIRQAQANKRPPAASFPGMKFPDEP